MSPTHSTDYPVMLQLAGRRCVVVGAGAVGRRKLQSLLDAGAVPVVIDPAAEIKELPAGVTALCRPYVGSDLDGATLAFAATGDAAVNRQVAADARRRAIPVNIADDPQGSDFTLPAVARRDDLTLAVATAGQSPAAAALIRDRLAGEIGPAWGVFVRIAARLRALQLTSTSKPLYNQRVLQNLLERGLIPLLESGDQAAVAQLLDAEFAGAVTLADLDISLPKGAS